MVTRRKFVGAVLVVLLAGLIVAGYGCKKAGPSTAGAAESVELRMAFKGSELCCKPDQVKCEGCSLVKGSPGCCSIPKDAQSAAICTACGQIKGSELCCKPDQSKSEKCGLVEGSPGCCKLPKT